jgi:dTDP-4-dehydrorhamnose reductase
MNKKILVLGSSGLIGHQVYNYLKTFDNFTLFDLAHTRKLTDDTILLDMLDEKKVNDVILKIKPDCIINCVGILIEGSKKDPKSAIFLNAYMPHHLMKIADEINAKLIHISTDCVFSGKKGQYNEGDEKDGTGIYARTKALGEITNSKHLTLRTSVVGPELKTDGEELFHWFMQQKESVNGFTKSIWSGVTTLELAKAVKRAIDKNTTGLYHITNGKSISKYDLLNLFKKHSNHLVQIIPVDGIVSDKSFVDNRQEFDYAIPSYDVMVEDLLKFIDKHRDIYSHYMN